MTHGVADYIREDIPIAIEEIQRHSGPRPVFLLGHSLGGLVAYAAAPNLNGAVAGIASIGSPYHFTRGSRSLGALRVMFRAISLAQVTPLNVPASQFPTATTTILYRHSGQSHHGDDLRPGRHRGRPL